MGSGLAPARVLPEEAGARWPQDLFTHCWCLLAVFLVQLAGPAGGNASDPRSPPVCLIEGGVVFYFCWGRGVGGVGREETREELRQIFETCVKDKRDGSVSDSHTSLSAERGSSCLSAWGGGSKAQPAARVDYPIR